MFWDVNSTLEIYNKRIEAKMSSLYLWLNMGSLIIPFLFSFHPKIRFDKEWGKVLPGILFAGIFYLAWDIIFTIQGVWGFNEAYLIGVYVMYLPLEEVLFFFCIPYACLFTHYSLSKLLPFWKLNRRLVFILNGLVLMVLLFMMLCFMDRTYTFFNALISFVVLIVVWRIKPVLLASFYPSFAVILVPFLLVNGILTGSFIPEEVVWYQNVENMGVRIGTIPLEDFFYAFGMLLLAHFISEVIDYKRLIPKKTNTKKAI